MAKKKTKPSATFTDAQLAEVRRAAFEHGFVAFTNDDGRTIYLNEDYAPARYESGVEIVLIDRDVVWLDRYDRNADDSIKAEADGTAATIEEVIAAIKGVEPPQ